MHLLLPFHGKGFSKLSQPLHLQGRKELVPQTWVIKPKRTPSVGLSVALVAGLVRERQTGSDRQIRKEI